MTKCSIEWPPVTQDGPAPQWTGSGFRIGDTDTRILSYRVGDSGWNEEFSRFISQEVDEQSPVGRASREHAIDQLSRHHPSPSVICDIGCANGYMLKALRSAFPGAFLVGGEYVRQPLEDLYESMKGIPLVQFDLTRCPLPDSIYDCITILNVLEHIEDDIAAIRQVYRMLKPNGIAVIEVPAAPSLYDSYDRYIGHFRRYRMLDLINKLEGTGFEIMEESHLGFFVYPLFWLKKKMNQKFLNAEEDTQRKLLIKNARMVRRSRLLSLMFRLEAVLRGIAPLPFGVRCQVTCRKPA